MSAADWCGRKPDDPQPIVYQGCHESDARRIMSAGINSFCLTYYEVERAGKTDVLDKHPAFSPPRRVFIDSGAFSFLVKGYNDKTPRDLIDSQVAPYLTRYVEWIKSRRRLMDWYATFDYVVEAPVVYEMTKRLQKMGIKPVPVYHGDASIDWVKRYIDEGHKLIALSKRFFLNDRKGLHRYYEQVFKITEANGTACHGFAATDTEVWKYPFYSVDSTSLVKQAGMGFLTYFDVKGVRRMVSVSANAKLSTELQSMIIKHGLTLEQVKTQRYARILFNAFTLQEFLTQRKPTEWKRRTLF